MTLQCPGVGGRGRSPLIIWCYGRRVVFLHLATLFGLDAVLVAVSLLLLALRSFSSPFPLLFPPRSKREQKATN